MTDLVENLDLIGARSCNIIMIQKLLPFPPLCVVTVMGPILSQTSKQASKQNTLKPLTN